MKQIAVVTNQMVMGGIEKSLITLLKELTAHDCKVTLFLCKQGGELYDQIPADVEIRDLFYENHTVLEIIKAGFKKGAFHRVIRCCIKAVINKIDKNSFRIWKRSIEYTTIGDKNYDIAIAYGSPVSMATSCVANMKNTSKRYVWIHNEIDKIGFDLQLLYHYYDEFDKIFCVSKRCREIFVNNLPRYLQFTEVFYNYIDLEDIVHQSQIGEGFSDSFDGMRLLTVARVCEQKGQDIIPDVLKQLEDILGGIKWYCIGNGEEDIQKIQKKAAELGVADNLVFLGNQNNPYPYFRNCDIYVQPSRHEGFGITISEAKVFSKPIVLTNFAGSDEQIDDQHDGMIVPFDPLSLASAIRALVENAEMRHKFGVAAYQSGISCTSDIRMIIGDRE